MLDGVITEALDRSVDFRFLTKRARAALKEEPDGMLRFTLRAPHRTGIPPFGVFGGAYRIRAEGRWIEPGR